MRTYSLRSIQPMSHLPLSHTPCNETTNFECAARTVQQARFRRRNQPGSVPERGVPMWNLQLVHAASWFANVYGVRTRPGTFRAGANSVDVGEPRRGMHQLQIPHRNAPFRDGTGLVAPPEPSLLDRSGSTLEVGRLVAWS